MSTTLRLLVFSVLLSTSLSTFAGNEWTNKQYKISGSWDIVQTDAGQFFVLGDNFKTKSGPDLKLFLIKNSIASVANKEALHEEGTLIAALDKTEGAQRYLIPDNINLAEYKSLAIHCQQYSVVWGGIDLP